jgi:hypothetical protein
MYKDELLLKEQIIPVVKEDNPLRAAMEVAANNGMSMTLMRKNEGSSSDNLAKQCAQDPNDALANVEEAAEEAREAAHKAMVQQEEAQRAANEQANKVAISKERNTKMEKARVVPHPWNCKLCSRPKRTVGNTAKTRVGTSSPKSLMLCEMTIKAVFGVVSLQCLLLDVLQLLLCLPSWTQHQQARSSSTAWQSSGQSQHDDMVKDC